MKGYDIVVFLFVGLVLILILTMKTIHWPKYRLDPEHKQRIKQYGLMHFTSKEHVDSILQQGLQPNKKGAMSFLEKNMVWLYIADPECYKEKLDEIRKKGDREKYDKVIYFYNIPDDDIKKMRMRKKPEAIVYKGTFKTTCMEDRDV